MSWYPDDLVERVVEALEPTQEPAARPEDYLGLAERIIRCAAGQVDGRGAVAGPWRGEEATCSTGRFLGALGALIGNDCCADMPPLLHHCALYLARRLAENRRRDVPFLAYFAKEIAWELLSASEAMADAADALRE